MSHPGHPAPAHQAVMVREALENLKLEPGDVILDATVGSGGHAREMLKEVLPGGRLIGIDQDSSAIELAAQELSEFGTAAILRNANFRDLDKVLEELGIEKVSGILFDLGVSLTQLQDPSRGFGIKVDSPLDMRMDRRLRTSAFDVVNRLGEHKLVGVLQQFGEERFARRIARAICEERVAHPISTTKELAHIVMRNIPYKYRRGPIHPATKTFQAIRIYVNDELGALEEGLKKAIGYLEGGARACVISFHSLEDALVKNILREFSRQNIVKIITKKPLTPKAGEIASNPRCRSAKLRTAERIKDL